MNTENHRTIEVVLQYYTDTAHPHVFENIQQGMVLFTSWSFGPALLNFVLVLM